MGNSDIYTQSSLVSSPAIADSTVSTRDPLASDFAEKASDNKIWNYIKSRFNSDNWFGTAILPANIFKAYNLTRSAMVRKVDGEVQPDKLRAVNYGFAMGAYTWSFLSMRGAKLPPGDTVLKRMIYALKHPNTSSSQFEYLAFLGVNIAGVYNNIEKGVKAFGIGLKPGEKANTTEKARLFNGISTAIWQCCMGYGHFRRQKEERVDIQKEPPRSVLGVISRVWKHDKPVFIGTLSLLASPCFLAAEGLSKRNKSRDETVYLLRGAMTSILTLAAYQFYTFQRLVKSNFTDEKNAAEKVVPDTELLEREDENKNPDDKKSKHADRISGERTKASESGIAIYQ